MDTYEVSTVTTDDQGLAGRSSIGHSTQGSLNEVLGVVLRTKSISASGASLCSGKFLTSCWKTLTRFRKPEVPGFWPS